MRRAYHALVPIVAIALGMTRASDVAAAPTIVPTIIAELPHDPRAFTQGLVLNAGVLFESTGLNGQSSLRRVDRASGQVTESVSLPTDEFGEGLALVGERLVQLTWMNGLAHVYDANGFQPLADFEYTGEGWGLCFDGARLVMSDGSDQLLFRDPDTFELLGRVSVRDEGAPVARLNELECVAGEVFANVWMTDDIVRVDAATGNVITRIDARSLHARETAPGADVLNGIAHDPLTGHFLLTGKLWSTLFEVELALEPAAEPMAVAPPDPDPVAAPAPADIAPPAPAPEPAAVVAPAASDPGQLPPAPAARSQASGGCTLGSGLPPSSGSVLALVALIGVWRRARRASS